MCVNMICVRYFVDILNIKEGETEGETEREEEYLHKKGKPLFLFTGSVLLLIWYNDWEAVRQKRSSETSRIN